MTHNEDSARKYIQEKKIIQLSQTLTTALAYSKPENPVEFLIQVLTDIKTARDSHSDIFVCFSKNDIKAMFSVLDPFGKGTVTRPQLEGALKDFGIEQDLIPTVIGEGQGPYNLEAFEKCVTSGFKLTLFSK